MIHEVRELFEGRVAMKRFERKAAMVARLELNDCPVRMDGRNDSAKVLSRNRNLIADFKFCVGFFRWHSVLQSCWYVCASSDRDNVTRCGMRIAVRTDLI